MPEDAEATAKDPLASAPHIPLARLNVPLAGIQVATPPPEPQPLRPHPAAFQAMNATFKEMSTALGPYLNHLP